MRVRKTTLAMMAQRHAGTQTHSSGKTQRPEADRFQHRRVGPCLCRSPPTRIAGKNVDGRARRGQRRQKNRRARSAIRCPGTAGCVIRFQRNPERRPCFTAGPGSGRNRHAAQRQPGITGSVPQASERDGQRAKRGVAPGPGFIHPADTAAGRHGRASAGPLNSQPVSIYVSKLHGAYPTISRGAVCGSARCPRLIQTVAPSSPAIASDVASAGSRSQD
ncbi:MAG: hypothetical protein ACI9JL_000387 [Paracoccaceae bacterium]|jgi:hypothetical protein